MPKHNDGFYLAHIGFNVEDSSKFSLDKLFLYDIAESDPYRIIDTRSPSEFLEDHIPESINIPVLNDLQRNSIGIQYRSIFFKYIYSPDSKILAKVNGAAQVCHNIGEHLENESSSLRKMLLSSYKDNSQNQPGIIFYCARGGKRSQALAQIVASLGIAPWVGILDNGYKTWRSFVKYRLETWPNSNRALGAHPFIILSGLTGSAKTVVLRALSAQNKDCLSVLDLEKIANHKGSILGAPLSAKTVKQKKFDSNLYQELGRIMRQINLEANNHCRAIWTECESKWIGPVCQMSASLWSRIRGLNGTLLPFRIFLEIPLESRINHILTDYNYFTLENNQPELEFLLERFRKFHSDRVVDSWKSLARKGNFFNLVGELLTKHYDPNYTSSRARVLRQSKQANQILHLKYNVLDQNVIQQELIPQLLHFNDQVISSWHKTRKNSPIVSL